MTTAQTAATMTRTYQRFDFRTRRWRAVFAVGSAEIIRVCCALMRSPTRSLRRVHRRDWNCANGLVCLTTDAAPHAHQVSLALLSKMINGGRVFPMQLTNQLCQNQGSGVWRQVFKLVMTGLSPSAVATSAHLLLFFCSGELMKSERRSFSRSRPKLTSFYCYLLSGFC